MGVAAKKINRADVADIVSLNAAVPVALLGWDAWHDRLGANPASHALHTTGMLALIYLLLSLAVTPAIRMTGAGWIAPARRVLGLSAFFHALLHLYIFYAFDRAGSLTGAVSEIFLRPYLMVGAIALAVMIPLAATSTEGMMRRLGPKRWKALHRLAYVAAVGGVLHFYMLVKADVFRPLMAAWVLAVLLGYRLIAYYLRLRADSRRFRAGKSAESAAAQSPAMINDVQETLRGLGVADDSIRVESSISPARNDAAALATQTSRDRFSETPAPTPTETASVTFARSGKTTPITQDKTILEAAEELGVSIPYDCRAGICGTCKTKLLSGRVEMDSDDALDPIDRANDVILSCQARCLDAVVVDA